MSGENIRTNEWNGYLVKRVTHLFCRAKSNREAIEMAKSGKLGEVRSWYSAKRKV